LRITSCRPRIYKNFIDAQRDAGRGTPALKQLGDGAEHSARVPVDRERLHGELMRVHKNGKGGRHVAIERGLRLTGSGWPFRREMRELASMCFDVPRRPVPPASHLVKEQKPWEA
jgi:hypothetical protein